MRRTEILWQAAIEQEFESVKIIFKIISEGENASNDNKFVDCQMVFNIKMEDFCERHV